MPQRAERMLQEAQHEEEFVLRPPGLPKDLVLSLSKDARPVRR
jgi:hypothetical protein